MGIRIKMKIMVLLKDFFVSYGVVKDVANCFKRGSSKSCSFVIYFLWEESSEVLSMTFYDA